MSELLLIKHCAPTLAGLKTANIFNCKYDSDEQLKKELCRLNKTLGKKGIRIVPLKKAHGRVLIYAYRPKRLHRDLDRVEAAALLSAHGYDKRCPACCVKRLADRLHEGESFPHEIGLFLGYPPEDVHGFIENPHDFKLNGYWKVYGDEHAARRLFARYKKCTSVYLEQYEKGRPLERLAVAG